MYFSEKKLDFINNFIPGSNTELELRFKFNNNQILTILEYLKQSWEYSNIFSVVLLNGNNRRESFYDTTTFKKINHIEIEKQKISDTTCKIQDIPNIKCVLAKEIVIYNFNVKQVNDLRLKKRFRFIYENYNVDITQVKIISALTPKLPEVITEYFKNTQNNINYEFEIEFTKKVNVAEINKICEHYLGLIGINKTMNIYITEISNVLNSAGIIKKNIETLKHLTNNPIVFTRKVFENNFDSNNYMVMEKTDGLRCLLKISGKCFIEILEGEYKTFGECTEGKYHIIDCEKLNGEYYAFDILLYNTEFLQQDYLKRLDILNKISLESGIFRVKEICKVTCENMLRLVYNGNTLRENVDGLIFQEIKADYFKANILKWKPAELITFDFLIVPMPYKGVKPFISNKNIYLLMVGCSKAEFNNLGIILPGIYSKLMYENNIKLENYNPIPFMPPLNQDAYIWESDNNHTLSIGEFLYTKNGWRLLKLRHDKTLLIPKRVFGNNYFVAEAMFNELQNPLKLQEICNNTKIIGTGPYFINKKSIDYISMTKFNNFVKFNIMKILRGTYKVLDIASGRGSDIFIYNGLEVKCVTFVEPDKQAFNELSERLRKLSDSKFYVHTLPPSKNMNYTLCNEDYNSFIKKPTNIYNALVCNFAAHYFLCGKDDYITFNNFCVANKINIIILTIYDSEIISKHMQNNIYQNDKYYIKQDGNQYFVKHHFATELIPENIINTPLLIKCMRNYNCVIRDSFKHYINLYETQKKIILQELDSEYSSFYQYLVFRLK